MRVKAAGLREAFLNVTSSKILPDSSCWVLRKKCDVNSTNAQRRTTTVGAGRVARMLTSTCRLALTLSLLVAWGPAPAMASSDMRIAQVQDDGSAAVSDTAGDTASE